MEKIKLRNAASDASSYFEIHGGVIGPERGAKGKKCDSTMKMHIGIFNWTAKRLFLLLTLISDLP